MLLLAAPGFENLHPYLGTDAGAGTLLIGAALAMVWPTTQLASEVSENRRRIIDLLGVAALATIVIMFVLSNDHSTWLSRGGLLLLSLATAVLVGATVHPASVVGPCWAFCHSAGSVNVRTASIYGTCRSWHSCRKGRWLRSRQSELVYSSL